ncbi:uncharacterized protein LOC134223925 isoform X1 [Armigeres subalbatus]|uniref:uncharacterized protein LOC134223925 isoform X1 n=2 Tax=Armigeres subalbatus TaxID=124917 RepID=UPI002ED176AF
MVNLIVIKNRESASKMFTTLKDSHRMMSTEEAFEYFLDCDFTKYAYEQTVKKNPSRFPSYHVIKSMKKVCSPLAESIEESPSKIQVKLQALMNHTAERIIKIIDAEIVQQMNTNDYTELVLSSSWGMDGSTGYSQYHQALSMPNQKDDSDVFSVTTTPIQLYYQNNKKSILWHNLTPQSIRFCRPIMLEFIKESKEMVLNTKRYIENQISELVPVKIQLSNDEFVLVDFIFVMSMIDGKVLNYVTDTSSMSNCPICGATPNVMSDIKLEAGYESNENALHYGKSPLHAWMRFF